MKRLLYILFSITIVISLCIWANKCSRQKYADYQAGIDNEIKQHYENEQFRLDSLVKEYMNGTGPKIPGEPVKETKLVNVQDVFINRKNFTIEEFKIGLSQELKTVDNFFDKNSYSGSVISVMKGVSVFYDWGNFINLASRSNDNEVKKLAAEFERKVIKVQIKQFPLFRELFAKEFAKMLWESDYSIYARGDKNERIIICHSEFVRNKAIKAFQDMAEQAFIDLRFKRSVYKYCKECGDPEIIDMETPKDDAICFY